MSYSLPTNDINLFLSELNLIRRNLHKTMRGDGVYNSEFLILKACQERPYNCLKLVEKINAKDYKSDFHEKRVASFASMIKKFLKLVNQ